MHITVYGVYLEPIGGEKGSKRSIGGEREFEGVLGRQVIDVL